MKILKGGFVALQLALVSASVRAAPEPALDAVLPFVAQQVPGRLLDARSSRSTEGGLRYRIKWLTKDGRVIWLSVDARTGRVSG